MGTAVGLYLEGAVEVWLGILWHRGTQLMNYVPFRGHVETLGFVLRLMVVVTITRVEAVDGAGFLLPGLTIDSDVELGCAIGATDEWGLEVEILVLVEYLDNMGDVLGWWTGRRLRDGSIETVLLVGAERWLADPHRLLDYGVLFYRNGLTYTHWSGNTRNSPVIRSLQVDNRHLSLMSVHIWAYLQPLWRGVLLRLFRDGRFGARELCCLRFDAATRAPIARLLLEPMQILRKLVLPIRYLFEAANQPFQLVPTGPLPFVHIRHHR